MRTLKELLSLQEAFRIINLDTTEEIVVDDDGNITDESGEIIGPDDISGGDDTVSDEFNTDDFEHETDDYFGYDEFDMEGGSDEDSDTYTMRPDGSVDSLSDDSDIDVDSEFQSASDDLALSSGGQGEDLEGVDDDEFGGIEDETGITDGEDLAGSAGEEIKEEDPNYQGVIRTVSGAYLVYKRKMEDGTFEELWLYNIGKNIKGETKIRRSVLSGTDIDPQGVSNEDGTQTAQTTTVGNCQFIKIKGLPN